MDILKYCFSKSQKLLIVTITVTKAVLERRREKVKLKIKKSMYFSEHQ